jgi:hypothetical protein
MQVLKAEGGLITAIRCYLVPALFGLFGFRRGCIFPLAAGHRSVQVDPPSSERCTTWPDKPLVCDAYSRLTSAGEPVTLSVFQPEKCGPLRSQWSGPGVSRRPQGTTIIASLHSHDPDEQRSEIGNREDSDARYERYCR